MNRPARVFVFLWGACSGILFVARCGSVRTPASVAVQGDGGADGSLVFDGSGVGDAAASLDGGGCDCPAGALDLVTELAPRMSTCSGTVTVWCPEGASLVEGGCPVPAKAIGGQFFAISGFPELEEDGRSGYTCDVEGRDETGAHSSNLVSCDLTVVALCRAGT